MVHVNLFGATTVVRADGPVTARGLGGTKPRQILEILALSAGTPVPKDRLAETLWEGRPPRGYVGTLESYVCVLRRAMGLAHGRPGGLETVWHGYVLDPEVVTVDLHQFRAAVRAADTTSDRPAAGLDQLQHAITIARGQLLADEPYATWAVEEREAVRREVAWAAASAAAHASALGRHPEAVRMARAAIDQDPFAEDAWRALMTALNALGRRPAALRAYLEVRTLLARELGTDPAPETQDLYVEILAGRPSARSMPQPALEEVQILTQLLRQALGLNQQDEPARWSDPLLAVAAPR